MSALRGYGPDMCRFISCPLGQYCVAGICQPVDYGLGGGYGGRLNSGTYGLYAAASKLCADTVDCYSGQICQAGRCIFQTGGIGYPGVGGPYGRGSLHGYALGRFYSPYFGMNPIAFSVCGGLGCPFDINCLPGRCLGSILSFFGKK